LHGGAVNLASVKQIAANQTPVTDLEKQINEELRRQGMSTEKDIMAKELDSLQSKVSVDQLKQRYDDMARLKTLLFR